MIEPREALARRAANDLLDELQIEGTPVPVADIVRQKDLVFEERDGFPDGVYGALFRVGNRFGVIISRASPSAGHRRFTIAHELGHYHIPDHVDRLFDGNHEIVPSMGGHFRSRKDPLEVEADCFANELLMPQRFVRPLLARLGSGISAVQQLADEFETSLSSAAIRYSHVAAEPTVVLVSHNGVVEWAATSQVLWSHRWAKRSWKGEWAPRGSGTRRLAMSPDRVVSGASDGSSLLLCEWIEGAPEDVEAVEEAMGLGTYGRVLTVISTGELRPTEEYEEDERQAEEQPDWRSALRGYRMG